MLHKTVHLHMTVGNIVTTCILNKSPLHVHCCCSKDPLETFFMKFLLWE